MTNETRGMATSTALGTAAGAATSATLGGMGLAVGGTAVSLGIVPVTAAGAVLGAASYGGIKAVADRDPAGAAAAGVGALGGAGVAATLGGMGLVVGGGGLAVGAAPVVALGAVVGLALYGAHRGLRGILGR